MHPDHTSHNSASHPESKPNRANLRLVAWETTRNCNLNCVHCRAAATRGPYSGELNTEAALRLLDQIREVGQPIVILTGGEPLLRPDIFDIARYGDRRGLRMVMAPNGTLITSEIAEKIADSGIKRISISLDGATRESHDTFRGVEGAFDGALEGIRLARQADIEVQINTTITQANLSQIPAIQQLAVDQEITAAQYEETLNWFYDQRKKTPLQLKATCAPHYYRILRQRARQDGETVSFKSHGLDAVTRGCLGGIGFCFVSHRGIVQPCGFLDTNCGDVTKTSFADIWHNSKTFLALRDYDQLEGKCGKCEYKKFCGGCRARAFEATGDILAQEPLCSYEPATMRC